MLGQQTTMDSAGLGNRRGEEKRSSRLKVCTAAGSICSSIYSNRAEMEGCLFHPLLLLSGSKPWRSPLFRQLFPLCPDLDFSKSLIQPNTSHRKRKQLRREGPSQCILSSRHRPPASRRRTRLQLTGAIRYNLHAHGEISEFKFTPQHPATGWNFFTLRSAIPLEHGTRQCCRYPHGERQWEEGRITAHPIVSIVIRKCA